MMIGLPSNKQDVIDSINSYIPLVLKALPESHHRSDRVLFINGVHDCYILRDRYNGSWRDDWSLGLRTDGNLVLVYWRRQRVNGILIQSTNPFKQRVFGLSLGWIWKRLSLVKLVQIEWYLMDIDDPLYAGYSYPISAFTVRSGRKARSEL